MSAKLYFILEPNAHDPLDQYLVAAAKREEDGKCWRGERVLCANPISRENYREAAQSLLDKILEL